LPCAILVTHLCANQVVGGLGPGTESQNSAQFPLLSARIGKNSWGEVFTRNVRIERKRAPYCGGSARLSDDPLYAFFGLRGGTGGVVLRRPLYLPSLLPCEYLVGRRGWWWGGVFSSSLMGPTVTRSQLGRNKSTRSMSILDVTATCQRRVGKRSISTPGANIGIIQSEQTQFRHTVGMRNMLT